MVTEPVACPPAPGALEEYWAGSDESFTHVAQRAAVPGVPGGAAGAAGPEQDVIRAGRGGAGNRGAASGGAAAAVFPVGVAVGSGRVNARRLELLRADPAIAPHEAGVLVIDDSGDRKDGAKTARVGRQWLGRYGKIDNGSHRHHAVG